ncbi:hypothetical protein P168DRAFT_330731 [Aspergillus campestris IBT 28561]|uniref:Uncharacterized protein n=1 Tax=Aspergillus campestris (strain IBT 28561) TaxID=1392248 RepID=A0A2I1CQM7_ASPC2|nr:uncharacterized protein P168DRAFT_330731 [Aspergillus campestris IBT 28561]PKX99913.1 hypothetical protein P168DRAFT_330731 [Aspergillus campestris IBT 28561]
MGRPGKLNDEESHVAPVSRCRPWVALLIWCGLSYCCMALVFAVACYAKPSLLQLGLLPIFVQTGAPAPFYAYSKGSGQFAKPANIKTVALVPFRDHKRTEILDCYLQRNLVKNHGFLDEVAFIPLTNDTTSLEWLTSTVEKTPHYSLTSSAEATSKASLYIWIDGDTVFFEDHTIPTIVKTKLDHPDSLVVSANVVNQAALKALHSHTGVALSYLPELSSTSQSGPLRTQIDQEWRASQLPPWEGPSDFKVQKGFVAPFQNHRWLRSGDYEGDRTPIGTSMYSDEGPGLDHWTVSAQQHYSFLHHLELDGLHHYKFPVWNNPKGAVSRNFLCFEGGDASVVPSLIEHGKLDELSSETWEDHIHSHVMIDGKGLAAHYSAGDLEGLDSTDVLERYRAYAQEMVCPELLGPGSIGD